MNKLNKLFVLGGAGLLIGGSYRAFIWLLTLVIES